MVERRERNEDLIHFTRGLIYVLPIVVATWTLVAIAVFFLYRLLR